MNCHSYRLFVFRCLLACSAGAFSAATPVTGADVPTPVPATPSVLQVAPAAEPGTRLTLTGFLRDTQGRPIAGAELHVYQTDATVHYIPERPMDEPHALLAGFLRSDADGKYELRTIRPGGYTKSIRLGDRDRHIPAHIHLDVTAAGHVGRRMQLVFADDPLLTDPYWADWVIKLRQPVLAIRHDDHGESDTLTIILE